MWAKYLVYQIARGKLRWAYVQPEDLNVKGRAARPLCSAQQETSQESVFWQKTRPALHW